MPYRRTASVIQREADTRVLILDAATRLVREEGYSGCSMAAVAASAGRGTGTVYRYFPDKGELFAEVFRVACGREVTVASAAGAASLIEHGSHLGSIVASVEMFARRALSAPRLAYALMVEPVDVLVDVERLAFRESFAALLAVAARAAVDAGEIPDQDVDLTATAVIGAINEALIRPLDRGICDPTSIPALLTFTIRSLGGSMTHTHDSQRFDTDTAGTISTTPEVTGA